MARERRENMQFEVEATDKPQATTGCPDCPALIKHHRDETVHECPECGAEF